MAAEHNEATARLRNLRIAPRKVRLVADMVRGMDANTAIAALQHTPKRAARPIAKLIKSAVFNAQNERELDPDALVVARIWVDEGAPMKRFMPRAMGRATPRWKRTSHVTVVVSERL